MSAPIDRSVAHQAWNLLEEIGDMADNLLGYGVLAITDPEIFAAIQTAHQYLSEADDAGELLILALADDA